MIRQEDEGFAHGITSNCLLDDPNNYWPDDDIEYLENNILDLEPNNNRMIKDLRNEEEVININSLPEFNSSQKEEDFNVYDCFSTFNVLFFQSKLDIVRLEWSKRMTTCAGIFYKKQFEYIIRLSEPLLKFRTTKEIKETLIHEMIHAWVEIKNLDQSDDKGGHGYNFQHKMYEINKSTGFNITVYHSFHDEVDYYKKYIWRCDGECRNRMPYYGYVKRATNRAPGKNDTWWENHETTCGGRFIKEEDPIKISPDIKVNSNLKLLEDVHTENDNSNNLPKENKKKHVDLKKNKSNNKKIDEFFPLNKIIKKSN